MYVADRYISFVHSQYVKKKKMFREIVWLLRNIQIIYITLGTCIVLCVLYTYQYIVVNKLPGLLESVHAYIVSVMCIPCIMTYTSRNMCARSVFIGQIYDCFSLRRCTTTYTLSGQLTQLRFPVRRMSSELGQNSFFFVFFFLFASKTANNGYNLTALLFIELYSLIVILKKL